MQIYRMGICTGKIYDDEKKELATECCRFLKADSYEEVLEKAKKEYSPDTCENGCDRQRVCPAGKIRGIKLDDDREEEKDEDEH